MRVQLLIACARESFISCEMIVLDPVEKEIGFNNFNHFCLVNNGLFV